MTEWLMDILLGRLFEESDEVYVVPQKDNEIIVISQETNELYLIRVTPGQAFVTHAK